MKVIIFGANGMLGTYLTKYLSLNHFEVIALTRSDLDISNISSQELFNFLESKNVSKEDVIINACGSIPQRMTNLQTMIKVNSLFPTYLGDYKNYYGCNVIHITTDCVFSGKTGNYCETDLHDATDMYGKSKSLGEYKYLTTIRTSIIGEENRNKKSLLEWVRSNKNGEIYGYHNHLWNGVTCLELSKIISNIIHHNKFWNGVRHVYSPNTVSKYELVSIINDVYNLNIKIQPTNTDVRCFRNLYSIYNEVFTYNDIKTQIKELKNFKFK